MKKINVRDTIQMVANIGVIAGIFFLGIELNQNNSLLAAQARTSRAQVRIEAFDLKTGNIELLHARLRQRSGAPLTEIDQALLESDAEASFIRWAYVYGEWQEGLINKEAVPTESWRQVFSGSPAMQRRWKEIGSFGFPPDFVQWMEENVVN